MPKRCHSPNIIVQDQNLGTNLVLEFLNSKLFRLVKEKFALFSRFFDLVNGKYENMSIKTLIRICQTTRLHL